MDNVIEKTKNLIEVFEESDLIKGLEAIEFFINTQTK